MRVRKTGRFLAPLALLAVLVAVVVLVRSALTTTHHAAPAAPALRVTRPAAPKRRFYVVRPGDTLSTISLRTGVPVATLESLNPRMTSDPNALQTGQSLRLR
jgi:nucleoid-associated protein YgaU